MSDVAETYPNFEELLVNGYIRDIEENLNMIIPATIYTMCLNYRGMMDWFSKPGYEISLSDDGLIATKKSDAMRTFANTSYGTKWIDTNQNSIVKWTFEIIQGKGIIIGIANNDFSAEHKFFDKTRRNNIYYAYGNNGIFYDYNNKSARDTVKYGDKYGEQYDVIMMELNLKTGTIEYYKNEESQGIVNTASIKHAETKYKMMVSLLDPGDSVKILDFEWSKC